MATILVEFLKNQWKLMRDAYRRCVNKRDGQTRSGAAASKMAKCKYFDILSFLHESLSNKVPDSNIDLDPKSSEINVNEHSNDAIQPYFKPISSKEKPKKEESNLDRMLINSLKDVSAVCDKVAVPSKSNNIDELDDPDTLFCKSLVSTLKSLPPRKNKQAKIKIQQLLFELEFDE